MQSDVGLGVLAFGQRHRGDDHRRHDAIFRRQLHPADAARGQAHRADVILGEADGLSLRRHQQELAAAGADAGPEQLITVVQPDDLGIRARLIHQVDDRNTLHFALDGRQQQQRTAFLVALTSAGRPTPRSGRGA